ncbi:MAG: AAA family ATPase [Candidatus Sulfotelmatobacter sp.]
MKEQPFGVTPDPRYLYPSPTHREALASLAYAIRSGRGFMSMIAKPGMGKTTILFQLLSNLEGTARVVFLFQTLCTPNELLRGILRGLGVVDEGGDAVRMQEQLNSVLLAEAHQGRRVVVIIDEAQNLEDSALELVRMLSNFESTSDKLMQIILAGQPQLRETLASPNLVQLRQRISIFARLQPFSVEETHLYIRHRLEVAGYDFKTPLFTPAAEALIAKHSEGIPRNINNICFNALSLGCVMKQKSIEEEVVRESLHDLNLNAEGAFDPHEEPAEPNFVALSASKPVRISRQPFARGIRLAACVMLLLQLLIFTGARGGRETLGTHSLLAVSSNPQVGAQVPTEDHPSSSGLAVNGEPSAKFVPVSSADEISRNPEAISLTPRQKSPHRVANFEPTSDPDKLWAQVRNESSDAEIELARLYIEGTAVPQNCTQAKILLLAASRRGNARAAELLNTYGDRCR